MDPIVRQGLDLMLYGMGAVFTFLALMVLVLFLLEKVIGRFPGPQPAAPKPRSVTPKISSPTISPAHRAAVEKAIKMHLRDQK